MNSKDMYIRTMQVVLDKWNYEIDTMTAKADKVTGDSVSEYSEQIRLLQERQATARQKIRKLEVAGEINWEEMKPDIELAWTAMQETITAARSHFR